MQIPAYVRSPFHQRLLCNNLEAYRLVYYAVQDYGPGVSGGHLL